ncbi:hypothetical protein [Mesorhizobium sp. YM1C-6-2]|uniref:hypothetical protein n=1 Tax=Mesorhizobium sp. YM1C-6-2 TaxID=1827501 RepID=UPI0011C3585F|nr:hypothetical protein [Mesorhizobium sp. YM1C-6-2]
MRTKTSAMVPPPISPVLPAGRETVVERLRRRLAEAPLDCGCRDVADDLLDRASAEENLMRRADGLADARKMRDAIVVVLALLGELDELTPDEPDLSVFGEIADLFEDVTEFAALGAKAARQAAGEGNN